MTEYGTIKIPRDEYEKHNEKRESMGLTWSEYIDGQSPDMSVGNDIDNLCEEIADLRESVEKLSNGTEEQDSEG